MFSSICFFKSIFSSLSSFFSFSSFFSELVSFFSFFGEFILLLLDLSLLLFSGDGIDSLLSLRGLKALGGDDVFFLVVFGDFLIFLLSIIININNQLSFYIHISKKS